MKLRKIILTTGLLLLLIILGGCSPSSWLATPTPTIDLPAALTSLAPSPEVTLPTPGIELPPDPAETQSPDQPNLPEEVTHRLWVAPYLPNGIMQGVVAPAALEIVSDPEYASLQLSVSHQGTQVTSLVFAFVAPFPTLTDGISFAEILQGWQGNPGEYLSTGNLYLTEHTSLILTEILGEPAGDFVQILPADDLLTTTWAETPAWAIVPFEDLVPQWKVLAVDGQSPLYKDFETTDYPLSMPITLTGEPADLTGQLTDVLVDSLPPAINRDSNSLSTVVLTGVTALVRATAYEMEEKGVLHPSGEIGPMLREADILHISNEVPFAESCPPPNPVNTKLIFCSADKYMELLEDIGTDVVELTGDHFSDWGTEATLHTFDLYDAEGWPYYGGGRTAEQGRLPITLEHNGNKIAFIGCNGKGGSYTPSVRGLPGAVDCDFDLITSEIDRLKSEGYLVIMTYQHHETYAFTPSLDLIQDFHYTAEVGADIVSGSQAHQSHGMSFYAGKMVMYGLGNIFFDQVLMGENTSRALIARHTIYQGELISTEIITIYFEDFSKPLYLLGDERDRFLRQIFGASDWGDLRIPEGFIP